MDLHKKEVIKQDALKWNYLRMSAQRQLKISDKCALASLSDSISLQDTKAAHFIESLRIL